MANVEGVLSGVCVAALIVIAVVEFQGDLFCLEDY